MQIIIKSKSLPVGTIRSWGGKKYKKVNAKSWRPVEDEKTGFHSFNYWHMTPEEFEQHKKNTSERERELLEGIKHYDLVQTALANGFQVPAKVMRAYKNVKPLKKARAYTVGTIRQRKAGKFKKDAFGHWHILQEIVQKKIEGLGLHPNMHESKTMHTASRLLSRHMYDKRGPFNRTVASQFLDEQYGDLGYRRFGAWKQHVIDAAEKFLKQQEAALDGTSVRAPTEAFQKVRKWLEEVKTASLTLKSDADRDAWLADKFAARKKPVAHILYAAREFIGRDTHLSMVPDQGFKGYCKSMIEKMYEVGPDGVSKGTVKAWEKSFATMFKNAEQQGQKLMPLGKALAQVDTKAFFKKHPKWFVYCCTRFAGKNDGVVNMAAIETYMMRAMKYHKSKNPPPVDYDDPSGALRAQVRMGIVDPSTVLKRLRDSQPAQTLVTKVKRVFMKLKRRKK